MERNRAWRRAHRKRVIEHTRNWMTARGLSTGHHRDLKTATTPHPCSKHCCGNPRYWFGEPTMQERRAPLTDQNE